MEKFKNNTINDQNASKTTITTTTNVKNNETNITDLSLQCEIREYFNKSINKCEKCDEKCAFCTGPSDSECIICLLPRF